jgi:hypothetical protein
MGGIIIGFFWGNGQKKMSVKNSCWLPKWWRIMCTPCWNRTTRYRLNMLSIIWKNRVFFIQKKWENKNALMLPAQFLLNSVVKSKRLALDYRLISLYPINPQNRPANEFEQDGLKIMVTPIAPKMILRWMM